MSLCRSFDQYGSADRSLAQQRAGGGVASAGFSGGGRSVRTSVSSLDGWTSDNDVTDNARRRTLKSSSSSTDQSIYFLLMQHTQGTQEPKN